MWDAYTGALAVYDPGTGGEPPAPPQTQPVPAATGSKWCGGCNAMIRGRLTDLSDLAAMLYWYADGKGSALVAEIERVSSSKIDPPSPSAAMDEYKDLTRTLLDWETLFRDLAGLPPAGPRGQLAAPVHHCVAFLGSNLDAVLGSDVGADFGQEVSQWWGSFLRRLNADPRAKRKPLRCPKPVGGCDQLMLVQQHGSDRVRCQSCGFDMSITDYEAVVSAAAGNGGLAA